MYSRIDSSCIYMVYMYLKAPKGMLYLHITIKDLVDSLCRDGSDMHYVIHNKSLKYSAKCNVMSGMKERSQRIETYTIVILG